MQKHVPWALLAVASCGRRGTGVPQERRVLKASVSSGTGHCHAGIVALRYSSRASASGLDYVTNKSPQFATLVSFSVLIPARPACCCLFGELRKDDLMHHGDVATGTVTTSNVEEPRPFQSQGPERLLPVFREATVC